MLPNRPPRVGGKRVRRAVCHVAHRRQGRDRPEYPSVRISGGRMTCSRCGTENEAGRKFCKECGASLALVCPSCGASNSGDSKFCGECGSTLATTPLPASGAAATTTERRFVSVLFADLVGFTTHLGTSRRGGRARAPHPVLRRGSSDDRASRRHRREVHRGRRDGGLGHAGGAGGRRRARRPLGARTGGRCPGTRSRGRARSAGAGRRADRRGGGDRRRYLTGDGHWRPGEHRLASAIGRRAGHRVGGRGDASDGCQGDRVRRGRSALPEGQGRARTRLACGAHPGAGRRRRPLRRAGAAVRRAQRGAAT